MEPSEVSSSTASAQQGERHDAPRRHGGRRSSPAPGNRYLRPRTAYRTAHGWDYGQAAVQYNLTADQLGPDLRGDAPMTGDKLRTYEAWPDGGLQPSVHTLELLARTYGTDPYNLLDQSDLDELPPSVLLALRADTPEEKQEKPSILDSIAGQAAAVIAVLAAVIYAAGGLTLGLKLWFFKLSWTSVLGQLPHDFILVTAVGQVILPCLIFGVALGSVIHHFRGAGTSRVGSGAFFIIAAVTSLAAGAVLGLAPRTALYFTSHAASKGVNPNAGLLQSGNKVYLFCAISTAITFSIAVCSIRAIYTDRSIKDKHVKDKHIRGRIGGSRLILAMVTVAFALIPCVASVAAAYLLPPVVLCAPTFLHPVAGQSKEAAGWMRGNLIGSNSQWAYIAQFGFNKQDTIIISRTITVVPVSAIRLEGIGRGSGCGDLSTR